MGWFILGSFPSGSNTRCESLYNVENQVERLEVTRIRIPCLAQSFHQTKEWSTVFASVRCGKDEIVEPVSPLGMCTRNLVKVVARLLIKNLPWVAGLEGVYGIYDCGVSHVSRSPFIGM